MSALTSWFPWLFRSRNAPSVERPDIEAVFSLSAIPSAGYVSRSGRRDLDQIEDAVLARGKSVVILGPARVGKSVFANKTIADKLKDRPVELSGRSVQSIDQFWMRLVMASGGYVEDKVTSEANLTVATRGQAKLQVGGELAKVSAELRRSDTQETKFAAEYKHLYNLQTLGEQFFAHFRPVILFEDFHEIKSDEVRREIASIAKEFGEKEQAKFVFISTSEPEIQLFRRDHQLRASIYLFPAWESAELGSIITTGFSKLNHRINQNEKKLLTRECFGSPAILNELCANTARIAARRMGQAWHAGPPERILGADVAEALRRQVDEYSSFSEIPILALAQSAVADRPTRYVIGESKGTIYHLILEALRKPGHAEPQGVRQEAVRNRIREILGNPDWQSPVLSEHLASLARTEVRIEHRKLFGRLPERPMSYDATLQKFFVNDPTLRTYLYRGGKFHYL